VIRVSDADESQSCALRQTDRSIVAVSSPALSMSINFDVMG